MQTRPSIIVGIHNRITTVVALIIHLLKSIVKPTTMVMTSLLIRNARIKVGLRLPLNKSGTLSNSATIADIPPKQNS